MFLCDSFSDDLSPTGGLMHLMQLTLHVHHEHGSIDNTQKQHF